MRVRCIDGRSALCVSWAIRAAALLFAAGAPWAATPPTPELPGATVQQPLRCDQPTMGRAQLLLTCTLNAADAPQRVTFKVHFTGSHDDTTASLQVTLGDKAVTCDDGSKTSTEYEDGDVTLECRFIAPARLGSTMKLRASAKWFHADYVGHEIDARRP